MQLENNSTFCKLLQSHKILDISGLWTKLVDRYAITRYLPNLCVQPIPIFPSEKLDNEFPTTKLPLKLELKTARTSSTS